MGELRQYHPNLETFVSHCGRFKSTIDYIFLPNCLFDSIVSSKVFEQTIDNTSDHLPVKLEINYLVNSCATLSVDNSSNTGVRDKTRWSEFTMENILTSYASPIVEELNDMNLADYHSLGNSAEQIKNFMLINKTNDLILNLTPENVTQHSRIVTTTHKGSSTPTKMSKIIGRQIH